MRAIIGSVLQKRRFARKMTQQQLAEGAGLERSYVSLLEAGKRMPSVEVIFRLAAAMDHQAMDLFKDIENAWSAANDDQLP